MERWVQLSTDNKLNEFYDLAKRNKKGMCSSLTWYTPFCYACLLLYHYFTNGAIWKQGL